MRHKLALISGIFVAGVIVLNVLLSLVPLGKLDFDLSSDKVYQISPVSEDYLKTLDRDVELVLLIEEDGIDNRLLRFMTNYAKLSPRLSMKFVSPTLSPSEAETYDGAAGSVVVRCAELDRSVSIPIVGFDGVTTGLMLFNYQAYAMAGQLVPVSLDAEGQLTHAVQSVTGQSAAKVYTLTGHSEVTLPTGASSRLTKANMDISTVNLLQSGGVPDDCAVLLIHAPAFDLSEDEYTLIGAYLRGGGHVVYMPEATGLTQFDTLLRDYGLELLPGFVGDTERYYKQYVNYYGYNCIFPVMSATNEITSALTTDAFLFGSRGMREVTPVRRASAVDVFMKTSANGLQQLEDGTENTGEYIVGAVVTEAISSGVTSRLSVISSTMMIDDSVNSSVPGAANMDIFMNTVAAGIDGAALISIPSKSLAVTYNTLQGTGVWSVFFLALVPLGFVLCGLTVWIRRRNR
jgi:ABC-2 type transport system permease protein